MRTHEAPLLSAARELADLNGWLRYHAPQCEHAQRQSEPGFPDLILVRPPQLIAIEIKRPLPDAPSAAQLTWLRAISEVKHAEALVLRPGSSYDELESWLA